MKNIIKLASLFFIAVSSVNAQKQDSLKVKSITFDYALGFESMPYAPLSGVTIGDNMVTIAQFDLTITKTGTVVSYWKSFDLIDDNEGSYDGFFAVQPFKIKKQPVKFIAVYFADFNFKERASTIIALETHGGKKLTWSVQANQFIYQDRSTRFVLNPVISYKQLSFSSWTFYEFGELTQSLGISYNPKKVSVSPKIDATFNIVYNTDVSSSKLRQDNTAMIGVSFSQK
jgi:hypothetical protein